MSSSFCTSVTIRVCVLIWGHDKSRSSGTAAKGPTCAVSPDTLTFSPFLVIRGITLPRTSQTGPQLTSQNSLLTHRMKASCWFFESRTDQQQAGALALTVVPEGSE